MEFPVKIISCSFHYVLVRQVKSVASTVVALGGIASISLMLPLLSSDLKYVDPESKPTTLFIQTFLPFGS